MERMAASAPRHTLTMRRRQSAPKTGGDLDQLFDTWSQDRYQRPTLDWPWQFIAILSGRVPEQRKVPLTWENVGVEANILL